MKLEEIPGYLNQIVELLTNHRYFSALVIITSFFILAKVMDITLDRIFRFIGHRFDVEFDDATVTPIRKPVQVVIFLIGCWMALLWVTPQTDSVSPAGNSYPPVGVSIPISGKGLNAVTGKWPPLRNQWPWRYPAASFSASFHVVRR